ncbi:MAG: S8 family serine peptidase [Candidatus Sericytochromatia bacterium]|nr:S8 family serine peptidase [Candidatus Tanganyikabacteria bacterium]
MSRHKRLWILGLAVGLAISGCGNPMPQVARPATPTAPAKAPVVQLPTLGAGTPAAAPVAVAPADPAAAKPAPKAEPATAPAAAPQIDLSKIVLPEPKIEQPSQVVGNNSAAIGAPPIEMIDKDTPKEEPKEAASYVAGANIVPNQLVIALKPGMSLARKVQAVGTRTVSAVDVGVTYQTIELPPGMSVEDGLAMYQGDPAVATATTNRVYSLTNTTLPNDPMAKDQWGYQAIKGPETLGRYVDARNITVAVLDTGVDYTHPDLAGRVMIGWNFAGGNKDVMDRFGHGTHVAGIIAAAANNGVGMAGVCSTCNIMAIKVLGDNGEGSTSTVMEGIKYAADYGARVINLSLGSSDTTVDPALSQAISYARSRGVLVVAAAGNNRGDVGSPANDPGAIAVSSTSKWFWFWEWTSWYSNRGPKVAVSAPGGSIWSLAPLGPNRTGRTGYAQLSGTSMAAPFVSGEAALIWATHPTWNASNVEARIYQSVEDKGATGRDPNYGYGRIRLDMAIQ